MGNQSNNPSIHEREDLLRTSFQLFLTHQLGDDKARGQRVEQRSMQDEGGVLPPVGQKDTWAFPFFFFLCV